jgi:plasmid replication initiation protein
MVADTPKEEMDTALLPVRHPQQELFLCDVADAILKDDMASMEHPFFSLATKPDMKVRRYENGDRWLEIKPGSSGLATIFDKDVLIYCISQLMAKANEGIEPTRHLRIVAKDLLKFTNRATGGKDYEALRASLDRLDGTRIRTNIRTGGEVQDEGFGLIDGFKLRRSEKSNRVLEFGVTLSDWVFNAIRAKEVLTLHPDYFRLRKAIDRRVYEIARKHCGKQKSWEIKVEPLRVKCGSRDLLKGFRHAIRELAKGDHLPDYAVRFDETTDKVTFLNRELMAARALEIKHPELDPEAYHDARGIAEGWDVHLLAQEFWEKWHNEGRQKLHDPTAAFIGFVRKVVERRGPAR